MLSLVMCASVICYDVHFVQPSSPIDYYDKDLKVELTEKLFAPENVALNPTDSQVSVVYIYQALYVNCFII